MYGTGCIVGYRQIQEVESKTPIPNLKLFPWWQPTSQKLTTPSCISLSKMKLKFFCAEPPRHNKAWERRLRPLIVFMLTPGPKTQMEPQEVQKGAETSHLWKPRGPSDPSLRNMNNHYPQQRKRSLQRQRHKEPCISPPKGSQEERSWIAEKRSGRFYMFCWIPSDPQPKIQGLVESQPPFFRLSCITTDTSPCITILKSLNQI